MPRAGQIRILMKVVNLLKYGFVVHPDGSITAPPDVPWGACPNCRKEAARTGKPCPCVIPEALELVRVPDNVSRAEAAISQGLYMRRACNRCSALQLECQPCTSGEGSLHYFADYLLPSGQHALVQVPKPAWRVRRAAAARAARAQARQADSSSAGASGSQPSSSTPSTVPARTTSRTASSHAPSSANTQGAGGSVHAPPGPSRPARTQEGTRAGSTQRRHTATQSVGAQAAAPAGAASSSSTSAVAPKQVIELSPWTPARADIYRGTGQ